MVKLIRCGESWYPHNQWQGSCIACDSQWHLPESGTAQLKVFAPLLAENQATIEQAHQAAVQQVGGNVASLELQGLAAVTSTESSRIVLYTGSNLTPLT